MFDRNMSVGSENDTFVSVNLPLLVSIGAISDQIKILICCEEAFRVIDLKWNCFVWFQFLF